MAESIKVAAVKARSRSRKPEEHKLKSALTEPNVSATLIDDKIPTQLLKAPEPHQPP